MVYQLITVDELSILEIQDGTRLASEQDALELVAACGEHRSERLLLHAAQLSEAVFDLHSGLLGAILLKLGNYRIRTALVLRPEQVGEGKFKDWVLETNRGRDFRVFFEREAALGWLSSQS
jgi:PadR family transcriptional regulator, regulatory protein AphA